MGVRKRKAVKRAALFVFALCMALRLPSMADELEDARQRDEELTEEWARVKKEQEAAAGDLQALLSDMGKLSEDIEDRKEALKEQEERYVDAKIKENDRYLCMKKRIKFMYEDGHTQHMLRLLLESKNMSDLLSKIEYVATISAYDRDMLDKYAIVVKDSSRREESIKKEYKELALLLDKMFIKQEKLESLIENRDEQISELDAKIEENAALIEELIEKAEKEKKQREDFGGSYKPPGGSDSNVGNGYFAHPCPGARISSYFGWREFDNSFHKGVDFAAPEWTPTYAAEEGTVVIAGWSNSAGNWVVINHGEGLVTKYMHHAAVCVSAGQYVGRGQQIGYVGSTGYSTGPHLHFQVEVDSVAVDPLLYL